MDSLAAVNTVKEMSSVKRFCSSPNGRVILMGYFSIGPSIVPYKIFAGPVD